MFCFDKSNNSMTVNALNQLLTEECVKNTCYRKRPSVTRSVRQEWTWWSDWPCFFVVELWRVTRQQTLRQRRQRQQRYTHACTQADIDTPTEWQTDTDINTTTQWQTARQTETRTDRQIQTDSGGKWVCGKRLDIGFFCQRPGSYVWLSWYRRQFISGRKVHEPWNGTKGATNSVIRTTAFLARY